jgi:type IV pilus assembly protein PilQ
MKALNARLAGVALCGVLAVSSAPRAAEPNAIQGIDVAERDGAVELSIRGTRAPSYTVFKLQDPPRLVVDLSGADVSAVASPIEVGKGGVRAVSTAQYKDDRSAVGRVVVALDGARRYEVVPRGEAVVVRVLGDGARAEAAAPTSTATANTTSTATATATADAPLTPSASAPPESFDSVHPERRGREAGPESRDSGQAESRDRSAGGEGEKAPAADVAAPSDHVVSRRVDEAKVGRAARAVTRVRDGDGRVVLVTDGGVARVEILELEDPPRLALDLHGVTRAPKAPVKVAGAFRQVRFGRDADRVRVVLDADGALPRYEVRRVKDGIAIVAKAASASHAASATPAASSAAPLTPTLSPRSAGGEGATQRSTSNADVPLTPSIPAHPESFDSGPASQALRSGQAESRDRSAAGEGEKPRKIRIGDVRFAQTGEGARIEIAGRPRYTLSRPDARTVVLSLESAELPKRLERSLDTSAFQGPVTMVSSFNQPGTGQVKIVASLRGAARDAVVETPRGLAWTFAGGPAPVRDPDAPIVLHDDAAIGATADARAAGFASEAPAYALSGVPQKRGYTGRRITLDFHDIDVRNLLRLIADVSKKNIVVADDVTGKVTVSLRNVPWDQALDLILRTKGLGKEEMGNVIRIAKFEDIAKEQEAQAKAAEARKPLLPLKVRLIPVNFARAGDVATRVKDVLSERGSVSTDERTNVIIVKDIADALVRAEGLVRNLDTEIPQVLIESRIVEAGSNFNRQIGVQWGGNATASPANGNPTGLVFPNITSATGAAGQSPNAGTAGSPNYVVNLPAAIGQGAGGGIGLVFGSIGGALNLNLRLSALENTGVVKTISAPKIATVDNKEATIGQGVSIPFSQVSASGVNTTFIEAKLELKVTPHVSADGSILLKIKATNNAPNPQLTGANGQPSISKREADTEVLVKDGETTVIGGIYTRQTATKVAEVPFFGKIPILGWFFRTNQEQDDHTELLIFITPRILNRTAATASAAAGG